MAEERLTATETIEGAFRAAQERFDKDQRFRALAEAVVHDALARHPDFQNREGHDFARDVAATVIERIFSGDAELNAQREMADRYRKIAEDVLFTSPVPVMAFSGSRTPPNA